MKLKSLKKQTLYNSIINYLTKNGNKELAKKNFHLSLIKASKIANIGSQYLLALVFKKLSVSVEVKDVHRRGKNFKIPFFITLKRQRYLSIKWFFKSIQQNKSNSNFQEKIIFELLNILKTKKAKSLVFKEQNIKLALANRSNIHYRW